LQAAPGEKEWKRVYWGDHYAKLEEIKKKVDPSNVFWCSPCVGADMLKYDDERLCKNPNYPEAGPAPQTYPNKNTTIGIAAMPGVPGIPNPLLPIVKVWMQNKTLPAAMPKSNYFKIAMGEGGSAGGKFAKMDPYNPGKELSEDAVPSLPTATGIGAVPNQAPGAAGAANEGAGGVVAAPKPSADGMAGMGHAGMNMGASPTAAPSATAGSKPPSAGGMEGMEGMDGMGGMDMSGHGDMSGHAGMDMGAAPTAAPSATAGSKPPSAGGMEGMEGMDGMGGMDMSGHGDMSGHAGMDMGAPPPAAAPEPAPAAPEPEAAAPPAPVPTAAQDPPAPAATEAPAAPAAPASPARGGAPKGSRPKSPAKGARRGGSRGGGGRRPKGMGMGGAGSGKPKFGTLFGFRTNTVEDLGDIIDGEYDINRAEAEAEAPRFVHEVVAAEEV
jgi:hypothetical protein